MKLSDHFTLAELTASQVAARQGIDIQRRGSGNIGFANVQRVAGWRAGLLTLAADIIKGFVPTAVALAWGGESLAYWTGLCAIAGHIFPVWLKFRGGKGIATGLGVLLVLQPLAALVGLVAYTLTTWVWRKSFVGSLLGTGIVCLLGTWQDWSRWWQYAGLILIAVWTLRDNIRGKVPDYDS